MKQVYIARDPGEAEFLKGILENEGIEAQVQGEWLFTVRGEVPLTSDTLPSVWVAHDSDVDRATEIVTVYCQQRDEGEVAGEDWQCPECGEQVESQFTSCWNCGAEHQAQG